LFSPYVREAFRREMQRPDGVIYLDPDQFGNVIFINSLAVGSNGFSKGKIR
jgi:hypothetical protein